MSKNKSGNCPKQNKTTQLKCAFSNAVHKIVEPNWQKTKAERSKLGVVRFTDAQKIELFNQIMQLDKTSSQIITTSKFNKRLAKRKYLALVAEGKLPKQKTTLAQWIAMQNKMEVA
ncbi:MAG: hypothetical protein ABIP51_04365 [Bacteroidia bacterium]